MSWEAPVSTTLRTTVRLTLLAAERGAGAAGVRGAGVADFRGEARRLAPGAGRAVELARGVELAGRSGALVPEAEEGGEAAAAFAPAGHAADSGARLDWMLFRV